ncbi:uncharacterized protein LOC123676696 [Harmonia axyridis]|uniref:uncharacterized protein LOC123676696 n=1 Tax=Harmonia axyridis TaxID=115357 RepID=UPI001E278837|nr:uncharacterized protein LOC123676696 [Harmonia axyridis]
MFFRRILILLVLWGLDSSQAQQYILDPRFHFQPQDDYYNQNKQIQYQQNFPGFSSFDPYLPQRDLQTSDVPAHLQKTLPQYRFSSKEQISKNELPYHNTVLFRPDHERSSQNVVPSTHRPNYSHFLSKNHQINPSDTETFLGQVTLDNSFGSLDNFYRNQENKHEKTGEVHPIPPKILRQHTRILAPDPEDKQNQLQENKYFVNENGEVFSTTLNPSRNIFPPRRLSTKLEVEDGNSREYPRDNIIHYDKPSYLSQSEDQEFNSANNFDQTDYEYEDNKKSPTTPKTTRSTTHKQADIPKVKVEAKSTKERIDKSLKPIIENNDTVHTFNEPVVSVVTTKSVINNTIIATNMPTATTEITTPSYIDNSTDSWVVVASVQTSKSISGAHYLPSSIVAQEERFTLLNEKNHKGSSEEEASTEYYTSYEEYDESSTEETTTMPPIKHSTESLIDKLDRVQSDLSSGLLTGGYKNEDNNIAVITENMTDKIHMAAITESPTEAAQLFPSISKSNTPVIKKFSSRSRPPTSNLYPKRKPHPPKKASTTQKSGSNKNETTFSEPKIIVAKPDAFLPPGYKVSPDRETSSSGLVADILKKFKESTNSKSADSELNRENKSINDTASESPIHRFGPSHPSSTQASKTPDIDESNSKPSPIDALLKIAKPVDINAFLPPGYKPPAETTSSNPIDSILTKTKKDDISAFLPPGYKSKSNETKSGSSLVDELLKKTKVDDISSLLPPGFKLPSTTTKKTSAEGIIKEAKQDDISAFLPPGYKAATTKKPNKIDEILQNSKEDDVSAFLPPGYKSKSTSTTPKSSIEDLFENSKKDDISAFLPPGFKPKFTTRKPAQKAGIEIENLPTSLLPSGYKPRKMLENEKMVETEKSITLSMSTTTAATTTKGGLKVVFPSRPGGKRINHKLTTPRAREEQKEVTQAPVPTIHKGWPTRATTEFTGWPTPSTTPISIEKLLESVHRVSPSSAEPENITFTTSTQTTITSTTTTQKPTTPGVCVEECDLVGTIKLVDGVKWVPELLDRNTKEWQILANEVQLQLEDVYSQSGTLKSLFKNLRIDGFSEGSVLVDYLVEMQNSDMHVSTSQMKKLFNEALESTYVKSTPREGKALNESVKYVEKAKLGKFIIDPMYTDFIVVPKQVAPTVGYAEDNLLLPQWAIAVIVIGLASLLFVIIFGVTVLVNRSKNAKKKIPTPLTDDMLNELNKDHMGGYDNYGIEDPYSVEVGFWDPRRMEAHREYNKLPKKSSSGSIHDNSMTNLYDSWNSQNNYNNSAGSYYGHHGGPGSSHRLYDRRRSYDTNF